MVSHVDSIEPRRAEEKCERTAGHSRSWKNLFIYYVFIHSFFVSFFGKHNAQAAERMDDWMHLRNEKVALCSRFTFRGISLSIFFSLSDFRAYIATQFQFGSRHNRNLGDTRNERNMDSLAPGPTRLLFVLLYAFDWWPFLWRISCFICFATCYFSSHLIFCFFRIYLVTCEPAITIS